MKLIRAISSAFALLFPTLSHAASIRDVVNSVSGPLASAYGGGGFLGIVLHLRGQVLGLLYAVGIFFVVWSGMRMVSSSDDGKIESAKKTIGAVIAGIMLAHLSLRITDAFYGSGGAGAYGTGSAILATEIAGVVNFGASIIATLAVLVIVISGIRAVASFGGDDGVANMRKAVYGVVLGIGLIVVSGAVKLALGLTADVTPALPGLANPTPILIRAIGIVRIILSFMALIAVGVIIYAGLLMVANFGNEDQFSKAKGIIQRAAIGLIVILLANTLIYFVVDVFI